MKDDKTDLKRRNFLKQGAVAGAVAVSLPAVSAASVEQSEEPEQKAQEGYRLTPHIKKYYGTLDS